jgi:hypothetical protein
LITFCVGALTGLLGSPHPSPDAGLQDAKAQVATLQSLVDVYKGSLATMTDSRQELAKKISDATFYASDEELRQPPPEKVPDEPPSLAT